MSVARQLPIRRAKGQASAASVPVFSLYGEADAVSPDFVHIEDIRSRSERYGWAIDGHRHHGLSQLLLLTRGSVQLQLEDAAQAVAGPFALLIPSGVVHGFRFTPGALGHVLTVEESALLAQSHGDVPFSAAPTEPVLVDLTAHPQQLARIAALFEQIEQECRDGGPASAAVLQWLTSAVLVLVLRQHASLLHEQSHGLGVAADYHRFRTMVEHRLTEHWPVARYAEALSLSESRLNRVCRMAAGKPALEIIHDRLTREARRRLVHVAGTISFIAYELGFEDPAYFWRFFRRHTGLTPRQFRGQQRSAAQL